MTTRYANLDDFDVVISKLMHDPSEADISMTLGDLTCTLSLLLRVLILPDVEAETARMIYDLCEKYSTEIIRRYPFSEGYIDYLYGLVALSR